MPFTDPSMDLALRHQRDACAVSGSPMYARLLTGVMDDYAHRGVTWELLSDRGERSVRDAVALRLLGGVHRLVLGGQAPELAPFYPSAGGTSADDPVPPFLATVGENLDILRPNLDQQVQTNEVGRASLLAGGFAEIARRTGLPLRQREIGSSAGLLLNWDRFRYEPIGSAFGPLESQVRFGPACWHAPAPDLNVTMLIADRRGADISPIDATSEEGRLRLLSFVWPDQAERLARLRAALDIAQSFPPHVERADAADWVEHELASPPAGQVTVLHHSIVLQYIPQPRLGRLLDMIRRAGDRATRDTPLAWLRMEPAGPVADLRLTMWPGNTEQVLATGGYHGQNVTWLA